MLAERDREVSMAFALISGAGISHYVNVNLCYKIKYE